MSKKKHYGAWIVGNTTHNTTTKLWDTVVFHEINGVRTLVATVHGSTQDDSVTLATAICVGLEDLSGF